MKIDYFVAGSQDCPLLRISGVTDEDCRMLTEFLYRLSRDELQEVAVHEAIGDGSAAGCRLTAKTDKRDIGVVPLDRDQFVCILRPAAWANVAGLVEPFGEGRRGFQWLDRSSGIALLLSPGGER